MKFKIVSGKLLVAIVLTSVTAFVLSTGSGSFSQMIFADLESQKPEIQMMNNLVLEDTQHDNIIRVQFSGDRTPPTVTSVNPANRASNVLPTTTISATFSEEVRPDTVTTSTFTLTDSDGNRVPGAVSIVRDHRTQPMSFGASFRPSSPLQVGEIYTAAITSGIRDMANIPFFIPNGNPMTPRTWSFMVGSPGPVSPPGSTSPPAQGQPPADNGMAPTVLSVTPVDGGSNVNPNALIGARFSELVQRSTVSTSTFTLTDGDGNRVQGTVIRPASTSNAISTATFDPVSPLLVGETYTASITQGIRDLTSIAMIPRTWSFTVGDSTSPSTPGDSTAPTVIAVSPQDGTSGVPTYATIKAKFSEPIRKSTVSTSTFLLKDSNGNAVVGSILLPSGPSTDIVVFDPSSELVVGKRYSVEITNGVMDNAGTALLPKKWSFTVGTSTGQSTGLPGGPVRVVFTQPADRAEDVPRSAVITVRFSKQVDPSTLSTSTFTLTDRSGNPVDGTVYAQQAGTSTIGIFDPTSQLRSNERYSAQITIGVKDTSGIPAIPKRFSFTTG